MQRPLICAPDPTPVVRCQPSPPPAGLQIIHTRTLAEYSSHVRNSFMPLQVLRPGSDFVGTMRMACSGDVICSEITGPEHRVERTPELIEQGGDGDYYKLSLMLGGQSIVVQDSRETVLREGDMAIYDTTRPYSLLSSEGARTAIIMFPRTLLPVAPDLVGQLTAVRLDRDAGVAGLVSPFMRQVMASMDHLSKPGGVRLSRNVVDLLATLLLDELDLKGDSMAQNELFRKGVQHIEAHLGDPRLSAEHVAAALFISPRYLQRLFQRNGTTVGRWIRERRLEHCRRELADRIHTAEPVAAIAARWGFVEASHFSRAFKSRFGVSPRAARAAL